MAELTGQAELVQAPAVQAEAPRARARRAAAAKRAARPTPVAAERLPVARVAVDVSLPHLDRPFDYLVPGKFDEAAVPGCRVRVRFAGQLVDGFLLARDETSDHQGKLAFLERVVSPEPVLTAEVAGLARAVADRYAGTLADVLRLAIPPRHATVEAAGGKAGKNAAAKQTSDDSGTGGDSPPAEQPAPADQPAPGGEPAPEAGPAVQVFSAEGQPAGGEEVPGERLSAGGGRGPEAVGSAVRGAAGEKSVARDDAAPGERPGVGSWGRYPAGAAFLAGVAAGRPLRAAWTALPGPHWAGEIARAAATTAAAGRGTVIVVPDGRDLDRVDAALAAQLGPGRHVCLSAGLGPAERYRRWLAALRGEVAVVAGLRAAMFAPVRDLGLVVVWDDGDDLHEEPRAPYPHTREVLALRAHRAGAAALIGGFARTAETTALVASGWARPLAGDRQAVRACAPLVRGTGDDADVARGELAGAARGEVSGAARLPGLALRTAREALAHGPVLVQVPRRGYLAAIACGRCREQARCVTCGGPLTLPGPQAPPRCGWCGVQASAWRCVHCGFTRLRSIVTGASRTAEELGRAFPAVPVRTSRGEAVVAAVSGQPAVVVATPGAEPVADGGYAAALLLDGRILLARASLRAAEEALRRWLNAAALVRPGPDGGRVVVVADSALAPVQGLIRWDPVQHAERECAEREELRFPPAVRMAAAAGPQAAVTELIESADLPPGTDVLGPVEISSADAGQDDGGPSVRVFFRTPRAHGPALARALHAAQGVRSARKAGAGLRVQMDPLDLI